MRRAFSFACFTAIILFTACNEENSQSASPEDEETDSQTNKEPEPQTDKEPDSQTDKEPDSQIDTKPDSQTDKEPDSQTDKEPDSPIDTKPDFHMDVELKSLLSAEQQAEIEGFQQARHKFEDMTLDEFRTTYGPGEAQDPQFKASPLEAQNLDLIREKITLSEEQVAAYEKEGFVISKNVQYETFFQGFTRIYSDDLPLYFSADAMLDALHLSFDRVLMDLEVFVLSSSLQTMLDKMEGSLAARATPDASTDAARSLDDAAVWLCVAKSLLNGDKLDCAREVDGEVNAYLEYIKKETPAVTEIFGRLKSDEPEDWSQFKPRGHYTKKESLKRYFRSMMWIQRIALHFSEYSRHARLAQLLTELLHQSDAVSDYQMIDRTIEVLVGVSDSMNAIELKNVADATGVSSFEDLTDSSVLEKFVNAVLASGVANQRINSAIMAADQSLESGEFTPIQPLFHFMGQRFIVDSYVFTNVVYDRVKEPKRRYMPTPLDPWFVLGNKVTVPLLKDELDTYQYQANLATLDYLMTTYEESFWQENFYNAWLSALMTLDEDTSTEEYPPVMRSRTWQYRMLHAQLASWAHLRHDTLLYAKPSYSMTDCEYPDAWVDPYPEFFEKIADVAELAVSSFDALGLSKIEASIEAEDPEYEDEKEYFFGRSVALYFTRLAEISLMLKDITEIELRQEKLTEAQLDFMNHLIFAAGGSGAPPFDGWYRELIYKHTTQNSSTFDPTIADVHTHPRDGLVLHVGTGFPGLMLIAIETDCQLRAYVGPVLSYHELIEGNMNRLTDEDWKTKLKNGEEARPSWTASFIPDTK